MEHASHPIKLDMRDEKNEITHILFLTLPIILLTITMLHFRNYNIYFLMLKA